MRHQDPGQRDLDSVSGGQDRVEWDPVWCELAVRDWVDIDVVDIDLVVWLC